MLRRAVWGNELLWPTYILHSQWLIADIRLCALEGDP